MMRSWGVWMAGLGLVAMLGTAEAGVVVCKKKAKLRLREDACKSSETLVQVSGAAVDPTGLAAVPTATDAASLGGTAAAGYQRRLRWAYVDTDGTIVHQSGGITLKGSITGVKILDFGESLVGRGIVATLQGGSSADGFIRVSICGTSAPPETVTCNGITGVDNAANELGVATLSTAAALTDKKFYVAVFE